MTEQFEDRSAVIELLRYAGVPEKELALQDDDFGPDFTLWGNVVAISNVSYNVGATGLFCNSAKIEAGIEIGMINRHDEDLLRKKYNGVFKENEYLAMKTKYEKLEWKNPAAICHAFNESIFGDDNRFGGDYSFIKNPIFFLIFAGDQLNIDDRKLALFKDAIDPRDMKTMLSMPELKHNWELRILRTGKTWDELTAMDEIKEVNTILRREKRSKELREQNDVLTQKFSAKAKRYIYEKRFEIDHRDIYNSVKNESNNREDMKKLVLGAYYRLLDEHSDDVYDFARVKIKKAINNLKYKFKRQGFNLGQRQSPMSDYREYFLSLDENQRKEFVQVFRFLMKFNLLKDKKEVYSIYNAHFKEDRLLRDMVTGNNNSYIEDYGRLHICDFWGHPTNKMANFIEFGYWKDRKDIEYDDNCKQYPAYVIYERCDSKLYGSLYRSSENGHKHGLNLPQYTGVYYHYLKHLAR